MEVETKPDDDDAVPQTANPSLHRRTLPYYLDNYVKQRPVVVSASMSRTSLRDLPEEQRPKTCSLPLLRGIDYTHTDLGADMPYASSHRCPHGDEMCDLCKRHFAKRQPNGYETFLNHIVTHLGHRPEFKQNAKQYIIHKPHPHLPAFVFSKCLHPKIFWRDVRKPRERTHQEFHGRIRTPKTLYYQRNYRTTFNRCPNSPETTLDSTGGFGRLNLQSSDDSDTKGTRRKSVGQSKSRKKKKRPKSSKRKKIESKRLGEKDEDSEASSDEEELTDSDENSSSRKKGLVKKEKKQRYRERNVKEGNEEYAASDEQLSNISEKNSNEEVKVNIKIEMKLPSLPQYRPKPPPAPITRNTNKQKMSLPSRQQPTTNPAINKKPTPSLFSFFGQSNDEAHVNKNKIYSWLQRQLDFSLQACRFELPIDGRVLENVTPEDYLRRYCVVTPQFQSLYQKIFRKYQSPQLMRINFKDLENALRAVAVNSFTQDKMKMVQTMTGVDEESCIDYKLFCGIAALTERVSSIQAERWELLEKCEEEPHMSRERIETADFSALDWKFKNIEIGEKMKGILRAICS